MTQPNPGSRLAQESSARPGCTAGRTGPAALLP